MPSTTIIAQPAQLMPAYNPIKYIIDNTNKNEPGFRYIFTIYPAAGSHIPANVVAQYRVLPVFSTGYGEQDISRLMQSLVTWKFESGQVNESWYQYDVDLGFEFIDNIDYTSALTIDGLNTNIAYTAHGFQVGDQVLIVQADGGVANPALEGLHTVIYAAANDFTVNVLWSTITDVNINGNVSYADQRKTQVLDDALITNKEVFNGAYSLGIYAQGSFPTANYLGTTDPSFALTSLGNTVNASSATNAATFVDGSNDKYLIMCRVYSGVTYTLNYYNTANDALLYSYNHTPADGLYNFEVIWNNLIVNDFYVEITGDNGSVFRYYFQLDTRCVINYDILNYLDRMGSWQNFAFQLRTYEKGQITREMYNQHIDGFVSASQWAYSSEAMGNKTYNTNVSNTLDLNTNWMDQYNADRFQELLTSPQVFYYDGTYYRACTIEATGFENFRQKNKILIKQSVTIKLALNTPING
jgi:hypothetical protein